jgi:hypothetical protein
MPLCKFVNDTEKMRLSLEIFQSTHFLNSEFDENQFTQTVSDCIFQRFQM